MKLISRKQLRGTGYGLRSPILIIAITFDDNDLSLFNTLAKALNIKVIDPKVIDNASRVSSVFLDCLTQLQQRAGLPVFENGKKLNQSGTLEQGIQVQFALPYFKAHATLLTLRWLCKVLTTSTYTIDDSKEIQTAERQLITSLQRFSPSGGNTYRFLNAAYQHHIPWRPVIENTFQFGYGENSYWLDSSFTEKTSVLGAKFARNKLSTARILKQAGLPIPEHVKATTINQAEKIAVKLGYPVVVKPVDKDRGLGVTAGILDKQALHIAYAKARKVSKNILIEKHYEGTDYRLYVFNGKMIWAVKRIPGSVIGNGNDTIIQLIAQLNADPRRGTSQRSPLKKLIIDEEAKQLLTKQGLTEQTVPPQGQSVVLRHTANISTGGMPVAVLDVHPDNQLLAATAANALKLDLAGIDMISKDISKSWLETSLGICEVNAQPQLGGVTNTEIYGDILTTLVKFHGRIPTILILEETDDDSLAGEIAFAWTGLSLQIALASKMGYQINNEQVAVSENWFLATQSALGNQRVQGLVISCTCREICATGLPLDHIDLLVLAQNNPEPNFQNTAYQLLFSQFPVAIIASNHDDDGLLTAKKLNMDNQLHQVNDITKAIKSRLASLSSKSDYERTRLH